MAAATRPDERVDRSADSWRRIADMSRPETLASQQPDRENGSANRAVSGVKVWS